MLTIILLLTVIISVINIFMIRRIFIRDMINGLPIYAKPYVVAIILSIIPVINITILIIPVVSAMVGLIKNFDAMVHDQEDDEELVRKFYLSRNNN